MAPAYISVEGGRGSGRSPEVCFLVLVFMNWAEEGGDYDTPLIGHWSLVDSCLALLSQGFQRFFLTKSVMPRV